MLEKVKLCRTQQLNDDGDIEQQCPKCGEWLYADTEFFDRSTKNKSGLHSWCKACKRDNDSRIYVGVNVCSQFKENGYTCKNCPMPIDGCPVEMKKINGER